MVIASDLSNSSLSSIGDVIGPQRIRRRRPLMFSTIVRFRVVDLEALERRARQVPARFRERGGSRLGCATGAGVCLRGLGSRGRLSLRAGQTRTPARSSSSGADAYRVNAA
jgi:hypothetical protein